MGTQVLKGGDRSKDARRAEQKRGDAANGYWALTARADSRNKTGFLTPHEHWVCVEKATTRSFCVCKRQEGRYSSCHVRCIYPKVSPTPKFGGRESVLWELTGDYSTSCPTLESKYKGLHKESRPHRRSCG